MNDGLGGCKPLEAPTSLSQGIRAYFSEILTLSPEDYRGVIVPMYVILDSNAVSGYSAVEQFKVPSTHLFAITGIEGFMAMPSWQSDDTDAGNGNANTDALIGMMMAKAMTTMISLTNSDRSQKIIEGKRQLNLSSIIGVLGGKPLDWTERPHIVPAGELLELTVTWNDSTVAGNGSEGGTKVQQYGVNLIGYYVRAARS